MISALQIRRFWTAFRPAWENYAGRKGIDPRDRAVAESWRHAILAEECAGQSSIKTLSQSDYDAVMLRLAVESGEQSQIAYWAPADERRMRHLIRERLREMSEADPPNRYGERYALAIVRQAKLANPPRTLDDLPAALLRKVLVALDRRLRKLRVVQRSLDTQNPTAVYSQRDPQTEKKSQRTASATSCANGNRYRGVSD